MKKSKEYFRGSLLGGAIGDALGAPVEFLSLNQIIKKYGIDGITCLEPKNNEKAKITDDTQMTLFTAEGILNSFGKGKDTAEEVYYAYLRWLYTQDYPKLKDKDWIYRGHLINIPELNYRRGPGNTCLSALESGKRGTIDNPINNSKGCGGVMRVSPAGLFYTKDEAFDRAADFAAITHGHPSGYLSAGTLAYIIASIIEGEDIEKAALDGLSKLKEHENYQECYNSLSLAIKLSSSNIKERDAIAEIGEGWVGEEALAIALYSSLKYRDDFEKALIASVNHDGDSDSTGAITGNILGAYLGLSEIPDKWIEKVELKDEICKAADDLLVLHKGSM